MVGLYWIVLLLTFSGWSRQDVVIWSPSSALDTPGHWTPSRWFSCSGDFLVMPKEAVASLFNPLTFRILILPKNGEILLSEGTTLGPGGQNCAGSQFTFSSNEVRNWWAAKNWFRPTFPYLLQGPGEGSQGTAAPPPGLIPDSDQVPCSRDEVVFPNGSAFRILLDGTPRVRTLFVNGQSLTSDDFLAFTATPTGRRFVTGGGHVIVDPSPEVTCSDVTGCACNNALDKNTMQLICGVAGPCPPSPCSDPVLPEGFCCPVCCSFLNVEYNEGFRLAALEVKLLGILQDMGSPVTCYVSKRRSGLVQSVCKDRQDGRTQHSSVFLKRAQEELLTDASLGISVVETFSSKKWISLEPSASGLGAGLVTGLIIAFLLIAVAGATAYYLHKKKRLPGLSLSGFDFVRFDRSKHEMELGTTPHEDLQPQPSEPSSSSSRRVFHNPLYSKEKADLFPEKGVNPVYGLEEVKD